MSFLKNLLGIKNINSPIYYKEFTEENSQLKDLKELSYRVKNVNKKALIDRDIKLLKIGLSGEKNVDYEIRNSKVPMICLHDIRLQDGNEVAQLDFVIITHRFVMVLETKQLNGDIYINEVGEFTRAIKNKDGRVIKKEGMYSPIAQNDRHVRILREILVRNGIIKTFSIISKVVISNPKSIINRSKAPAKIKKEIFKYDQITEVLNKELKNYEKSGEAFEDLMENLGKFLVENNKNIDINYYKKYSLTEEDFLAQSADTGTRVEGISIEVINELNIETVEEPKELDVIDSVDLQNKDQKDDVSEEIYNKLKEYRTAMAKIEMSKPYFIYNNQTLDEIIQVKPRTKEELLKVRGFGPAKVEKYGDEILRIISGDI
ncbi:MAG: NERD domain-containing protein [Clostridium sp.]|uniref:HRDC domain-containing protein n=1 Tax=Clostridium sp. TaxID=1506 RepID=UPI00304D96E6